MFLDINIQNYRLFNNFSINKFGKINIFTGAPNSGKSTILESIYLLSSLNFNSFINISAIRNYLLDAEMFTSIFYENNISNNISLTTKNTDFSLNLTMKYKNTVFSSDENGNIDINNINHILDMHYKFNNEIFDFKLTISPNKKELQTNRDLNKPSEWISPLSSVYISSYLPSNILQKNLKEILQDNNKKILFDKYLKELDASITELRFIDKNIFIVYNNSNFNVNIKSMGKGFYSYLTIVSSIIVGNKIILIDEIENGIHFSMQEKLINIILNMADEFDIQFFITTHSKEFLEILNKLIKNYTLDIKLYNMYFNAGNPSYVLYNKEEFDLMINNQNEIRD